VDRHSSPRSAKDIVRLPATMKWLEHLDIDQGERAFQRAGEDLSAWLGSATPEGWLCAKITAAALCRKSTSPLAR